MAEDNERREYLLYYIDLCESVNLIDEMGEAMMERAKMPIEFSEKERNYFSICSKNTVGRLRTSHRHLKSSTEVTADNRIKSDVVSELTEKVVNKIVKACKLVEDTLENVIYPYSQLAENKIFCHKLIADYQRYRCEVSEPKERQILMESSKKHYQTAEEMAKDLSPVDLSKLGIALNFSVFCYEIENEHKKAYDMAKLAFDEATAELQELEKNLPSNSIHDISMVLSIIKENLYTWGRDLQGDEENDED